MDIIQLVGHQLGVPENYTGRAIQDDRVIFTAHRSWLKSLLKEHSLPLPYPTHDVLSDDEVKYRMLHSEHLGHPWLLLSARVFPRQDCKVIPLPRAHSLPDNTSQDLSYSQLLHYVAQSNYKNLWKEAFKKCQGHTFLNESKESSAITPADHNLVMTDVLCRLYCCPVIHIQPGPKNTEAPPHEGRSKCRDWEVNSNVLPALCILETQTHFFVIQPHYEYSLHDCVTFSPAILTSSHAKPLFLVYQLLQVMRDMHDRGLSMGDITLHDISVSDSLWICVLPQVMNNIFKVSDVRMLHVSYDQGLHVSQESSEGPVLSASNTENALIDKSSPAVGHTENMIENQDVHNMVKDLKNSINIKIGSSKVHEAETLFQYTLGQLVELWVRGQVSNFDYLMALNYLSGRRFGNPNYYPVLPWIMDFTFAYGGWRDLSKSKYRLNKGDRQLDLTYESVPTAGSGTGLPLDSQIQFPHHISEVLSEITYYVYKARQTPKSVLCKYVRSQWVPAEYPSSVQRMQEWTPDECIPEFFSDPVIFKSIHVDLPDLEVPSWAVSPQDFVEKHRAALESPSVSERLHQWVDLTFGYRLSGSTSVKSKNVWLCLIDNHTHLSKSGIVQLFTHPHPHRLGPSPYYGKVPPKVHATGERKKSDRIYKAEEEGELEMDRNEDRSKEEDDEPWPVAKSRFLSKSRTSLQEDRDKQEAKTIVLPRDYNPLTVLNQIECLFSFQSRTVFSLPKQKLSSHCDSKNYKQIVATRRLRDMQVLGCLIVELFLAPKFRALKRNASLEERYYTCCAVLMCDGAELPRCVRRVVQLLLQLDCDSKENISDLALQCEGKLAALQNSVCSLGTSGFSEPKTGTSVNDDETRPPMQTYRYPAVTDSGLPPPSAHQLLQPLIPVISHPSYFRQIYNILRLLREYSNITTELELSSMLEDEKKVYLQKISESKVRIVAQQLPFILPGLTLEGLDLFRPYLQEMFVDPHTAVLAAWYLFDPIAQALGPIETSRKLLQPIVQLFDGECSTKKHMKLYHRSYLLQLIIRLGLHTFLAYFVTLLVEAVGGYKDFSQSEGAGRFHQRVELKERSHLRSPELDTLKEGESILSPFDEESSQTESAKNGDGASVEKKIEEESTDVEVEPEVFVFESVDEPDCPGPPDHEANAADVPLLLLDQQDQKFPDSPDSSCADGHSPSENNPDFTGRPSPRESPEDSGKEEDGDAGKSEGDVVSTYSDSVPKYVGVNILKAGSCQDEVEMYSTSVPAYAEEHMTADHLEFPEEIDGASVPAVAFHEEKTHKANWEYNISDLSAESIIWLSHRLGPVLTAKYISRNLLRMLALCYLGEGSLEFVTSSCQTEEVSIVRKKVYGDESVAKVLECLSVIAALYGEQLILLQYLPHMRELIASCKRKVTQNLEGGMVGCVALLNHIIPYLSDSALMDQLQDSVVKSILYPVVRLISSSRFLFPSGAQARVVLAYKVIDVLHLIALRIGVEMTKKHLTPIIQRFFAAFDRVFPEPETLKIDEVGKDCSPRPVEDSRYVELRRDGVAGDGGARSLVGTPMRTSQVRGLESTSLGSSSPPISVRDLPEVQEQQRKVLQELQDVFTAELAHMAYLPFCRLIGSMYMEQNLRNEDLIWSLCQGHDSSFHQQGEKAEDKNLGSVTGEPLEQSVKQESGAFGSNVAVVGNRIDLQMVEPVLTAPSAANMGSEQLPEGHISSDMSSLRRKKMQNTARHLRGNWLAYWEHEIGRSEKDTHFNFKQIKLQSYVGHISSVRAIHPLDNENSFISCSKDKTVKLWSLRSHGDASTTTACQWTYVNHKKSVLAVTFLESLRLAASCDSMIHIWDPFMGCLVKQLDSSRSTPVSVLRAMPPPSTLLLAGTTDSTIKFIDMRTCSYAQEIKVSLGPGGLICCMAVSPNGHWVAVGYSSGVLSVLDVRTGMMLATWKGHEGEVLQLIPVSNNTFASSSLDQTVSAWNADDGKFKYPLRGPTEPVHCLNHYKNELISGTTANRIGVHTVVDDRASFTSTRLRSDTFKGVLTSMAVLPLNRVLLLGADNGTIRLLC